MHTPICLCIKCSNSNKRIHSQSLADSLYTISVRILTHFAKLTVRCIFYSNRICYAHYSEFCVWCLLLTNLSPRPVIPHLLLAFRTLHFSVAASKVGKLMRQRNPRKVVHPNNFERDFCQTSREPKAQMENRLWSMYKGPSSHSRGRVSKPEALYTFHSSVSLASELHFRRWRWATHCKHYATAMQLVLRHCQTISQEKPLKKI